MRPVILVFVMLLMNVTLHAQLPGRKGSLELITVDQGLSDAYVTALFQDSRGFLWVGTRAGLNRYDGYRFHVFRPVKGDSCSLLNVSIHCITEDHTGNVWVGTSGGLCSWNYSEGHFQHCVSAGFPISGAEILGLVPAFDNCLIVTTRNNVYRFNYVTGQVDSLSLSKYSSIDHYPPAILFHSSGISYLAYGEAMWTIEWEGFRLLPFQSASFRPGRIQCMAEDPEGGIWMAEGSKLYRFDPASDSLCDHTVMVQPINPGMKMNIHSICADTMGNLWLGTDNGILQYNYLQAGLSSYAQVNYLSGFV